MEIKINGTNKLEEITIIDPVTNIEMTGDFLGNANAPIKYDDDSDVHTMDRDEFDWWSDKTEEYQALENRLHTLRAEHGTETIGDVIEEACYTEFNELPSAVNSAIDEWEGSNCE